MESIQKKVESVMRAAGVGEPTIRAFLAALGQVIAGERGLLPESTLEPVISLPRLDALHESGSSPSAPLHELAVLRLNGGLGTSMGLETTKSLIAVKDGSRFIDFAARQILHLRQTTDRKAPAFYLMNSFATQQETLNYLRRYPELWDNGSIDFLQNKVPKIDATTFEPVSWAADPELEWCPPGHGDLYPALLGSGLLDRLLARGVRVLFVSNSDNLGATADLRILRYFADSNLSFLMEVAERAASDRKGGHLARRRETGRLVLRESAQCPREDEAQFQDIARHRFFNTNSLWIRLDRLKTELDRHGGALPLPLITNAKTVDPKDPKSTRVLQLESAMGAAIECFEQAGALVVPRSRFSPVKTTSDLLALRSDAYRVTEDFRLVLDESRRGHPPVVELDSQYFRVLADFERMFPSGPPSLVECTSLRVTGNIAFGAGVICRGAVTFSSPSAELRTVAPGTYAHTHVAL